jgi:hypothetical protein
MNRDIYGNSGIASGIALPLPIKVCGGTWDPDNGSREMSDKTEMP